MAAFVKFDLFKKNLAAGTAGDYFTGTADTFKIALTNTLPAADTDELFADVANEVTGGGTTGYTAGGNACNFTSGAVTAGTHKLVLADPATWTAGADTMGPFRYAYLYNDTTNVLIGFWDYASSITLENGETFTIDLSATNGVFTLV